MGDAADAKGRDDGSGLPPLVEPDAAHKVGVGARERFGETVDNAGKALVAIAGAGVFFFGAGYFVEWQKFKRGGLPPDEILPLISQGRIAAAGVRELAISIFFGALVLAVLGWGGAAIARWATRDAGGSSRFRRLLAKGFAQEGVVPSVVFGALILLFVPLGWAGVIVTVVLTLLLYYSLRLIAAYLRQIARDEGTPFPLWRLLIAAALAAVVLSGVRQREFPEIRPRALVILTDQRRIEGSYVSSDSNSVLIRFRRPGQQAQLLILKRGDVEQVLLQKGTYIFPTEESLFGRIFNTDFACIPPECRAGGSRVGISSLF
ncbi:MAG TPA: hypothetical protein VGV69_09710 [Solirubrobacterales bacterium]|nr:hypothetical protein [Solirubrobacterales bacterium]